MANVSENEHGSGVRRVVSGVDGSESALHAALWAAREAEALGVPLTLVYAVHLPEAPVAAYEPDDFAQKQAEAGRRALAATTARIRQAHPGLTIESEITPLSPIHRLAELSAHDVLLVTGTRGHGGFAGMLLGSVSRALAAHGNGPLVVVRGPAPEEASGPVLLGLGPNPAESAVEYAFAAAQRYEVPLRVLRAWMPQLPATSGLPGTLGLGLGAPGAGYPEGLQDSGSAEAADAGKAVESVRARYPEVKVEIAASMSNPVTALTEAGADARLIVVAAHRHHRPFAIGAGYVVEGLLAHSPVPVAVIPVRLGEVHPNGEETGTGK
jgi:nucleotide-binding universal stress UspA family protein